MFYLHRCYVRLQPDTKIAKDFRYRHAQWCYRFFVGSIHLKIDFYDIANCLSAGNCCLIHVPHYDGALTYGYCGHSCVGQPFLLGLVKTPEALSGFSNQATITIIAMFILAAGLQNTGALSGVGQLLSKSKTPTSFLLTLFGVLALIAPFVSNTAIVAVFMPVVIAASIKVGLSPTKTLIPLSYVSQMIGVWTLIGTSSNLLVNSLAQDLGYPGFSMFQFLPLGVICTIVGCIYLLTIGRWTLPDKSSIDLGPGQDSGNYVTELRLGPGSKLIGTTVEESLLHQRYKVYVLELWRKGKKHWAPRADILEQGDVLLIRGRWSSLFDLKDDMELDFTSRSRPPRRRQEKIGKNND